MAEIKELSQITVLPGIRRDGTMIDGDFYSDGQWVRFQRGRPKKMGGYQAITDNLSGPIRLMYVWSRDLMNVIYSFSSQGVSTVLVDQNGLGNATYDRTPVGFTANDNIIWSADSMYDDAVGSQGTIIVAVGTNSLQNIDNLDEKQVYWGLINDTTVLAPITGLTVSGGVLCIAPYLVYFGSDGLVGWSDINQPQTLTTGDAGQDRVTGAKIVKGLPLRGGNGPGALLWSLDSLISMQYVGGSAIFRFTTLSSQTSILAQNSVIEYDGSYFWIGIDRFLVYSGGQVQELPNDNNINWFFDNLNFAQRQKVWAMKIPRYGEIWWFYPRGEATECTHAIIFNVREKTWYDCELARSAGYYSQVFHYPVMADSSDVGGSLRLNLTVSSGSFLVGDNITGTTSGTTGYVYAITGTFYSVRLSNDAESFIMLEGIHNTSRAGEATLASQAHLYSAFIHEKGLNKVAGDYETAIHSFFETCDFGYPCGGPGKNQEKGLNRWLRMVRVEPDFLLSGHLDFQVVSREFPQGEDIYSELFTIDANTGKIDLREQGRLIRLRFSSNVLSGFYEMGRTILHTEPGDVRS